MHGTSHRTASRVLGHLAWAAAALTAASLLLAMPLAGQERRSPTDDLLLAMTRAVNDLRYDEAIRIGRDLEPFVAQMRSDQVLTLRRLLALAWFPEEVEQQHPDSARRQLVALVRARPDAALEPTLTWRGLDSLFAEARARTFAVGIVRPRESLVLSGADAEAGVEVVTTRPARVRLSLLDRATGREVPHDSALVTDRGVLRLRAHDGAAVLIGAGTHTLLVIAQEPGRREVAAAELALTASATAVTLEPLPELDRTRLRPERAPADRARTAVKGVLFGVATAAIGSLARGGGRLARDFAPDPRAGGVGAVIALGSLALAAREQGREIPEAVRANAALRDAHARAVTAARDRNRRALAGYRVTLRVASEGE